MSIARSSGRRLLAAATATLVACAGLTFSPAAAETEPATAGGRHRRALAPGTGGSWTVTLVTGDKVKPTEDTAGRLDITTDPAPRPDGSEPSFDSTSGPEGTFVIPSDARPAIDAGILDRALFDVGYLAENGFADDRAKQVPLIVKYGNRRSQASVMGTAEALPSSDAVRSLSAVRGAARR